MPASDEWTSIPVRRETRDQLQAEKKDLESWSDFLEQLACNSESSDGRKISENQPL